MKARRIIPCLDVRDNQVVKGVQFENLQVVGDILERVMRYNQMGADELVFYDITASCEDRVVSKSWITEVARLLDIPFCVAGGIKNVSDAEAILHAGADKISINSHALQRPALINELSHAFGSQCVVIGIDSLYRESDYYVCQFTGQKSKTVITERRTEDWIREVQERGAGEIVLNCMNQDGVRLGYDIPQLQRMRKITTLPLIASGGAGTAHHFVDVFLQAKVDGALAASIFHDNSLSIPYLKQYLQQHHLEVRL